MAPVHRFSAIQRGLRDQWFAAEITGDSWTDLGPMREGESASIRVRNDIDGMIGVPKPGPPRAAQENHCRAAHEKLAFDLSYLASLPVSPVVLWGADAPAQYRLGRSISCWAFPQAMKWNEADAKGLISPNAKENVSPLVAAMRVFHTWISDTDRKGDHILVDLDSPSEHLNIAFIDHGHSMSYNNQWAGNGAPPPTRNYLAGVPEDVEMMRATADHIAAIDATEVSRLVNRIPLTYLPDPYRGHILTKLLARKGNLRAILGI